MVGISNIKIFKDMDAKKINYVDTIYHGFINDSTMVKLPVKFKKVGRSHECIMKSFCIFDERKKLEKPEKGYNLEEDYVIFT